MENTWLHNLKDGLDEIDRAIHTNCHRVDPPRSYDRALMQVFASWKLNDKKLKASNRCRIYLQVIFVSDLTTLYGNFLSSDAIDVVRFRDSIYQWSRQVRPTKSDRNLW